MSGSLFSMPIIVTARREKIYKKECGPPKLMHRNPFNTLNQLRLRLNTVQEQQ